MVLNSSKRTLFQSKHALGASFLPHSASRYVNLATMPVEGHARGSMVIDGVF